jgi:hypothetical protein
MVIMIYLHLQDGQTALMIAIQFKEFDIFALLVENGITLDATDKVRVIFPVLLEHIQLYHSVVRMDVPH